MSENIDKTVAFIKNKTGKDFVVYSHDRIYCSLGDIALADVADGDVTEIISYKTKNKTYFPIKFKNKEYVGYIDGAGDAERALCALIAAIIENGAMSDIPLSKKSALKNILEGDASDTDVDNFVKKNAVPDRGLAVYVVYCASVNSEEIVDFLENFKTNSFDMTIAIDEFTSAHVRFKDTAKQEEVQSLTDYAYLVAATIEEELGVKVNIGVGSEVGNFKEAGVSYGQALTALRMESVFEGKSVVSAYKDYVLVKMLEELPRYKLREYLGILADEEALELLEDPQMVETAEEFLRSNLNVSETSRLLYMHRNTLMYRLDKIERATGLDIRKFQDAMTFKLILILYKLLK